MVRRWRLPLLAQLILALVVMGLLPLVISLFQLSGQAEVLQTQAKTFNQVAARSAVEAIQNFLDIYLGLSESTADNRAVVAGLRTAELGEVLTGTVASLPAVLATGLFDLEGVSVMVAQRRDLEPEIGPLFAPRLDKPTEPSDPPSLEILHTPGGPVLRIHRLLDTGAGYLVMVVDANQVLVALDDPAFGGSFRLLLVDAGLQVLLGGPSGEVQGFPPDALDKISDKIGSQTTIFRDHEGGVVATSAAIENADWFVLCRQTVAEAEAARARLRQVATKSTALALGMTLLLSVAGFLTVIRPLKRLGEAQRELVGESPGGRGGSEIEDLEKSFAVLKQRIRDSEDLGQIFLGRFQVTDLVGSGAMGSVFRGWDDKLQRAVALKTVHLDSESVDREKLLTNLRNEAAITARIHQPNIVTVYDIEDRGSSAFIAMEYVEGVNLQKLLDVRTRLQTGNAIVIGANIARGLATAHDHFLVHHDVKPANILLGLDGSIKLTDFGVSLSISAASQSRDVICGTPGYLAPEVFEGDDYTPSSDLWAFGVVLWEMVVGSHPFRSMNIRRTVARTLSFEPEILTRLVPGTPESFSELVASLLEKDPLRRPANAHDVAEKLEAMVREQRLIWVPDLSDALDSDKNAANTPTALAAAPTQLVPRSG